MASGLGEALNKACAALEEQNANLEGVLAGIDYDDEHELGDAKNPDHGVAVRAAPPILLISR